MFVHRNWIRVTYQFTYHRSPLARWKILKSASTVRSLRWRLFILDEMLDEHFVAMPSKPHWSCQDQGNGHKMKIYGYSDNNRDRIENLDEHFVATWSKLKKRFFMIMDIFDESHDGLIHNQRGFHSSHNHRFLHLQIQQWHHVSNTRRSLAAGLGSTTSTLISACWFQGTKEKSRNCVFY